MTLLDITDLEIVYSSSGTRKSTVAVDGVDLRLDRGELVALVGESGSGKSTLARALVGLQHPAEITGGSIRFDGEELVGAGAETFRRIRGRRIGIAFQDPTAAFDPLYTVGTQIVEAIAANERRPSSQRFGQFSIPGTRSNRRDDRERAVAVLADVELDNPDEHVDAYPAELSGGQCQRAMIATALAGDPDVLIADEPTSGLDATTQLRVLSTLAGLARDRDLCLLVITHDLALAAEYCDRVAVLSAGQLVEVGATATVIHDPAHPETETLVNAARTLETARGRRVLEDGGGQRPAPTDEPVVELRDVTKEFVLDGSLLDRLRGAVRTRTALDGLDLTLVPGETVGLVGESGSGKSTIVDLIAGLTAPTGGEVRIDGDTVGTVDGRDRELLADVGVVFQHPTSSLDPRWSIGRSIAEPLRRLGWSRDRRDSRVRELVSDVNLPAHATTARPGQLSGGQVQRAAIARAIAPDPRLLLLDEPVSALDATTRSRTLELLADVGNRDDRTTVFVTHDFGVVGTLADRVGVLQDGRLVELDDAARVLAAPNHPVTRDLLAAVSSLSGNRDATAASNPTSNP